MKKLEPPDTHFLSAAVGWMELGNPVEAKAELARVDPDLAEHPSVLEVKWNIHAAEGNWTGALQAAERLVSQSEDQPTGWLHRAYALRRVAGGGLEAARSALLPAAERFPNESTIPYNLACYACQLNQLDEARRWFQRALSIGGKAKLKSMASADPDLAPLWDEIKKL